MFEGVSEQIHYVAAKAGVLGFSRSLARAVGEEGITVNLVPPGLTLTQKVKDTMPQESFVSRSRRVPSCATRKATISLALVLFLASDDADFIFGQTINVDGGKHML
jgi:3-oxoacyl-[acyl-carrier protein] reductase